MQIHKGVAYFHDYCHAKEIMERFTPAGSRLVSYLRGWTIQYRISGPYYPETI